MKIGMMTPVNGSCVIRNAAKNIMIKMKPVRMVKKARVSYMNGTIRLADMWLNLRTVIQLKKYGSKKPIVIL